MPAIDALDHAMRDPARFVPGIRRLGGGVVAMTGGGELWRMAGRSAVVYALKRANGRILALRVLQDDQIALSPRYAERMQALATAPELSRLRRDGGPLPGDMRFLPAAITVERAGHGVESFPLLTMEYLPGGTLAQAATRAAEANDRTGLSTLAERWKTTALILESASFSHGDLRPGNIVLREQGTLAVVDLDTAIWPGAPASRAPRDFAHRDRIPALALYTALLALAERPDRRRISSDQLLFDISAGITGETERLLSDLQNTSDQRLANAARVLGEALTAGPGQAPSFASAIELIETGGSIERPHRAAVAPEASPTRRDADHPAQMTPVSPDWGVGVGRAARPLADQEILSPARGAPLPWPSPVGPRQATTGFTEESRPVRSPLGPPPADLEPVGWKSPSLTRPGDKRDDDIRSPVAATTREAAAAFEQLQGALDAADVDTVAQVWPSARTDPRASMLASRVDALLTRQLTARAERALRRNDGPELAAVLSTARRTGVALNAEVQASARQLMRSMGARDRLMGAVNAGNRAEIADLALTGALHELGRLPAPLALARDRALAWPHLERSLIANDDGSILAAYDPALFDADPMITPAQRDRIDLARQRTSWLHALRQALRKRDATGLRSLIEAMPTGAEQRLSAVERRRIERLVRANDALNRLSTALAEGSDGAVLNALAAVEEHGAVLPASLDWGRVRAVVDRTGVVRELRAAVQADPLDYGRIARLLPAVRLAFGHDTNALGGLDPAQLERAVLRDAQLNRMREAILLDDDAAIATAADPDPDDARSLLDPVSQARVITALARRHDDDQDDAQ